MPSFDATDLDNATAESGVVHQSTANTDHTNASELKQGYDYANFSEIGPTPVACFPLHEDTGTTVYDLAGSNNGTPTGGVSLGVNGVLGTTAYAFNGTDGFTDHGDVLNLAEPISVGAWVRPDTLSQLGVFVSNGSPYFIWFDENSTAIRFEMNDGTDYFGDSRIQYSDVAANEWNHIFATYDGSTARIYLNGSEKDAVPVTNSIDTTSTEPFTIGQWGSGGRYFDGRVADVRVYNTALTQPQIQTLYNVVGTQGTLTTQYKPV